MKAALSTMTVWLIAALVSVLLAMSWALDEPSETDAAQLTALNVQDAITAARVAAKEKP